MFQMAMLHKAEMAYRQALTELFVPSAVIFMGFLWDFKVVDHCILELCRSRDRRRLAESAENSEALPRGPPSGRNLVGCVPVWQSLGNLEGMFELFTTLGSEEELRLCRDRQRVADKLPTICLPDHR